MDELRRLVDAVRGRDNRRVIAEPPSVADAPTAAAAAGVGVPPPASPGPVGAAMAASIVGEPRRDRRPFGWLILAALVVLWIARDVLGPFVVAAVAAYAFSPLIVRAQRRTGWSRGVIVAIGYALLLVVIGLLVYFLAGRVGHEIGLLAASGPDSLATLLRQLLGTDQLQVAGQTITVVDLAREIQTRLLGVVASPGDAVHVAGEVGSIGLELILALIVTFYFLVDGPMLRDRTIALLPQPHRARTVEVLDRIHDVLGRWLRGQLALIALVATVVYVGLGPILHLPY